ncbi:MAG: protein kinase [Gammaproteobacteria bacterium]|nr:protein kinase [Gammaproteobacteria bacterium]
MELTEKIRDGAIHHPDKIMQAMVRARDPYRQILASICETNAAASNNEFFISNLSHDSTKHRRVAADILSQSESVNISQLFSLLHQSDVSKTEIIKTLSIRKQQLRPEEIINNAIKLNPEDAAELFKLVAGSKIDIDLSKLGVQPGKITDSTLKVALVRYLGGVTQPQVVELIVQFLSDHSKLVVFEAFRSLKSLDLCFDASVLLPLIINMSEIEQEIGLEAVQMKADSSLLPKLPKYLSTRSELINTTLLEIVVKHATEDSLQQFLQQLEKQDNWTRKLVIDYLESNADEQFIQIALSLSKSDDEFVRNSAQRISGYQLAINELEQFGELALNKSWQVRQRAIQALGKSNNPAAITLLTETLNQWPKSAGTVLDAVRQLGFSNGLKIALICLGNPDASIQRNALQTIMAIASEKHASNARDSITSRLPDLTPELTKVATSITQQLTTKFDLPASSMPDKSTAITNTATTAVTGLTMPALVPGTIWLDRYLVKKVIGQGAMGQVVLVKDEKMEELLVLKFMQPNLTIDTASRERFKREVKYARKVGHPNVIRVHDLIWQHEVCAISMEYFESRGMEQLLKQDECLDSRTALEILIQVCDGMAAAHAQVVIHRDLKPSNILINDSGLIKIADFGIASAGPGVEQTLTQGDAIIGSPAYLAPERACQVEADIRSDIYSLGIVAYYMFSGRLPYTGQALDVLLQHREGKAPMVHEVNRSANPEISILIKKLMAKNPDARPQSMLEVRDDFKRLIKTV